MFFNYFLTPTNDNLYHYAGNNPVRYTDPDGRILHIAIGAGIGAVVGAAVSAGCEVFNQVVLEGKSLNNVDMRKVGVAATGGAISGALAGSGVGLAGQIAGNAVISAAQNISNQAIDIHDGEQTKLDAKSLIVDTTFGAISGGAGGSGNGTNKVIKDASKQLINKISKEIKHKGLIDGLSSNTTKKAFKYFGKNIKKAVNQITDVTDSVILTTAQNTLNAIGEYIEKKQLGDCNE